MAEPNPRNSKTSQIVATMNVKGEYIKTAKIG
jgi:hypothetical protein